MDINVLLKEKGITKYVLSKLSKVPYATLNDICNGKVRIEKCSAGTIYRLARALQIPMEELVQDSMEENSVNIQTFEIFKSNVCHRVKDIGEMPFIVEVLQSNEIRKHFERRKNVEAFYLLGMLDYLSNKNKIPICSDYADIRCQRLNSPVYPQGILTQALISGNEDIKRKSWEQAIPEFKRFNIIENEVENVI